MPDLRVLYVIDSLAPGGAETSLVQLAPGLLSSGIDLHVLPLGASLELGPALVGTGAMLHRRETPPGRLGSVRAVVDVARRVSPDLVHTTLYESDVAGRIAAARLRLPSSTSIVNDSYGPSHYSESPTAKLHAARALDAVTARSARRFHAVSAAIANSVSPRLRIPRDKVEVIARGRDARTLPYRPTGVRESIRRDLGIPQDSPVILAIGRLEPQKGLHHLLAALPAVAQEQPAVVVLVAGKEGRSGADLRATAARLHVDVRFLGHRTDVASLLAAADTFCFPSEREGFGGVLVEAMAVGCPVVASAIPTTLEVLGPQGASVGTLVPVGDPVRLGAGLRAVLSDPLMAEDHAIRGRKRFEEHFTIDRVVEQMAGFFGRAAAPG